MPYDNPIPGYMNNVCNTLRYPIVYIVAVYVCSLSHYCAFVLSPVRPHFTRHQCVSSNCVLNVRLQCAFSMSVLNVFPQFVSSMCVLTLRRHIFDAHWWRTLRAHIYQCVSSIFFLICFLNVRHQCASSICFLIVRPQFVSSMCVLNVFLNVRHQGVLSLLVRSNLTSLWKKPANKIIKSPITYRYIYKTYMYILQYITYECTLYIKIFILMLKNFTNYLNLFQLYLKIAT